MLIKFDSNICRVCLKADVNNINIIENEELAKKFYYCTKVEVALGDGLPQSFCEQCLKHLHITYKFKHQSIRADNYLRSFVVSTNQKFTKIMSAIENPNEEEQHTTVTESSACEEIVTAPSDEDVELAEIKQDSSQSICIYDTTDLPRLNFEPLRENGEPSQNSIPEINNINESINRKDNIHIENGFSLHPDEFRENKVKSNNTSNISNKMRNKRRKKWSKFKIIKGKVVREPEEKVNSFDKRKIVRKANRGKYECGICKLKFSFRKQLTNHQNWRHFRKPHICPYCSKEVKYIKHHMKLHADEIKEQQL